ncbi:MAG: FeoB-associated Cys-rich membrane protein [Clostridiales bacterium]|nr:FeoB-associated Cys-rich membrane protein [Clostridiales bacterium]
MADFVVIVVLAVVIGGAIAYMIKQKKRGARCIGCSMGGCCSGGCNCHKDDK